MGRQLSPEEEQARALRAIRPPHESPEIPETVLANQLDRRARAELKTLSKDNADEVARHLVMTASLIDENPRLAHRHAISASRRAGRIPVVRETLAITAYAIGDYALALRELRTYRRLSGSDEQLALMVDCERGLGRPERALELGRSVPRSTLTVPSQVAVAISMSGARLDLGDLEAALRELQIPQLDPNTAFSYSPELFAAYATVLEDLGRADESADWRARAEAAEVALADAEDTPDDDEEIEVFEEVLESTEPKDSTLDAAEPDTAEPHSANGEHLQ